MKTYPIYGSNRDNPATAQASDLILAWISTLPLDQRRALLRRVREIPKVDAVIPNIAATIPANATLEQKAHALSGYLLDAIALHVSGDNASKSDIYALADAMAQRVPMQGCPTGNVPLMDAASMAYARDPDVVASAIAEGLSENEIDSIFKDLYGDTAHLPLHGGLMDILKKVGSYVTGATAEKIVADEAAKIPTVEASSLVSPISSEEVTKIIETNTPIATEIIEAAKANEVQQGLATQLESLRASLTQISESLANQTAEYQAVREDMIRAEWALALINADKEVVNSLAAVKPDFTSPTLAVSTVFSLVESLRQNTSLTKYGTLTRAISAMFGKKAAELPEWLQGDPTAKLSNAFSSKYGLFSDLSDEDEYVETYDKEL